MKAVTGNRLADGAVVYLDTDGAWTKHLADAALYQDGEAEAALERARAQSTIMAGVYLIEAEAGGKAAGRAALRETIRASGPTVRTDLGKQAGR